MKFSSLTLTILAALTILNASTVYASPTVTSKNIETNSHALAEVAQQEHHETPRAPTGPGEPLLYRRGELGKMNPSAVERPVHEGGEIAVGERHTKRAGKEDAGSEDKKNSRWHFKRADEHQSGGDENEKASRWYYKRADEHQGEGGGDENGKASRWHYKRSDEHQGGGDENGKASRWHYKRAEEHQSGGDGNGKASRWRYKRSDER